MLGNENEWSPWQIILGIIGLTLLIVFVGMMSGCYPQPGFSNISEVNNCLKITYESNGEWVTEVYDVDELVAMLHKRIGEKPVYFHLSKDEEPVQ